MKSPTPQYRAHWVSTLIALVATTVAGLWPGLASAQAELPELRVGAAIEARWDGLITELGERRATPLGLVSLVELWDATRWVPWPWLVPSLEETLTSRDTHPLVRSLATYLTARGYLARGLVAQSEALLTGEGYVTSWSIIGPFRNDGMEGYDAVLPPEEGRDPSGVYRGRVGEVGWRNVTGLSRNGYVDLASLAPPSSSAVVYAVTGIESSRRRRARLWTAMDGAYKVWLNGQAVAVGGSDLGGGPIREWWDVELVRGRNELVVKVAGESGPLGFYLRLSDRGGDSLPAWTADATVVTVAEPLGRVAADELTPAGSLLSTFEALLFESSEAPALPRDQALVGAALVLRRSQPRDASEPWRRFLLEGGGCLEGTPRSLERCADVQEHYWERRRTLTRAVELLSTEGGERNWVETELAELAFGALGEGAVEDSRRRVEAVLARDPHFVPALLLRGRLYEQDGQFWRARGEVSTALTLAPDSPEVAYEAVWSLGRTGDTPDVIELRRRTIEWAWDDATQAHDLASALTRAGRVEEGLTVVARALEVNPLSLGLTWLQAQLLESSGDVSAARETLSDTVPLFPGSVLAWEELGRFYVRADDFDSAIASLDRALEIEPQNQELAQYRSQLQVVDEGAFYVEHVVGRDAFEALRLPEETVGTRDYYHLVRQQLTRVHPNGLGTSYVQEVFRVQTRRGADQLREYAIQFTPDDEVVEILAARIIKPDGRVRESFDRYEESLSQPWYGLYYDYRALVLSFEDLAAGDVLEIQYTLSRVSSENLFDDYFGEFWFVQDAQPSSLTRYGIIYPDELPIHMRLPRLPHEIRERELESGTERIIELRDVPRIEIEDDMPGRSSVADYIHVSTFETWDAVAAWYWNLIEDQLVASPEIERTVAELVEDRPTVEERVRAIHEYVVRNTRYVGLEFGIHGFRPYRTTVVFARRFGDCKDTASLLHVMLGVAGIESDVVLVRTRDLGIIEADPPSLAVFNHAITYVPELDLFLDGTAGHAGLDELPYGDQGASSLIVGNGRSARFLEIPFLPASANQLEYSLSVDLTGDDAPVQGTIRATGQFAPPLRRRYEAEENRLEDFERDLATDYPGARVTGLTFEGLEDITRPVELAVEFEGATWLRGTEERRLLQPLGRNSDLSVRYATTAERTQPLELHFPFQNRYRLEYVLPEGLGLEADAPTQWHEESPFGRFEMTVEQTGERLTVATELIVESQTIEAERYPAFRAFIQAVERAVNRDIVLVRRADG